jgi:hypothetical protein
VGVDLEQDGDAVPGAAGVQVSAMPGRLPLMRVAVPFFSWASRALASRLADDVEGRHVREPG